MPEEDGTQGSVRRSTPTSRERRTVLSLARSQLQNTVYASIARYGLTHAEVSYILGELVNESAHAGLEAELGER